MSEQNETDFEFDMDDAKGSEFPDLQKGGPYLFEVAKVEVRAKKDDTDALYLNIEFNVVDTEDDALMGCVGRKHWESFSIGKPGYTLDDLKLKLWKTKLVFDSMVRDGEKTFVGKVKNGVIQVDEEWCARWEGRKLVARLSEEKYNGYANLRFNKIRSVSAGWNGMFFKAGPDGVLEEYADAPPKANGQKAPKKPKAAGGGYPDDFSDDDIAF